MVLHFTWGGHTVHLVNVYCPDASVDRQAYITGTLAPLWAANPTSSIFIGDWNYVDDPAADRRCLAGQPTTSDAPSMRAWQAAAPGAADAYRSLHPTRRTYTFIHRNPQIGHVARLDRAYVGSALRASVVSCATAPSSVSDHFPLVLELAPLQPPRPTGPGLARARVDFWSSPNHRALLKAWVLIELQGEPTSDFARLVWWPGFKQRLLAKCRVIRTAWRADTALPTYAAARQQVQAALAQLGAAAGQPQINAAMAALTVARAALRAAQQAAWSASERLQRQQWLHRGEQPNPCITEQLRALERAPTSRKVVALRSTAGAYV
jgi:hypothetical protein